MCRKFVLASDLEKIEMNGYPVSEMVNTKGINDPAMLNHSGDKLQIEPIQVRVEKGYSLHKVKGKSDKPWFENSSDSTTSN